MDATLLGQYAAEMMAHISEHYTDERELRTVAIIAEVDVGDSTEIITVCSDSRSWVQVAFLNEAKILVEERLEQTQHDEE